MKQLIEMFILDLATAVFAATGVTCIACLAIETYEVLALIFIATFLLSIGYNALKSWELNDYIQEEESEMLKRES